MPYSAIYGILLLISLAGLVSIDATHSLFLFHRKLAWLPIVESAFVFALWDAAGIRLGIFATNQADVIGAYIGSRNFPLEEVLFLLLLCYLSALLLTIRHAR